MHSKKTDKWNSWPCYLNVSSLTSMLPNSSREQLSHICPVADWGWISVETLGKAKEESFSFNARDSPLIKDIYKTGSAHLQKITQAILFSKSRLYNISNEYVQFNIKPEELTKGALLLSFVRRNTYD